MTITRTFGNRKARMFFKTLENVPPEGKWRLESKGRDKETSGLKYSMNIIDRTKRGRPYVTLVLILVTDCAAPRIIEDNRERFYELWSS